MVNSEQVGEDRGIKACKLAAIMACVALAGVQPAFGQTGSTPGVFVDGAIMADRDPTDFFYGSTLGVAGRVAVGGHLSDRHSFRFEVDVPKWRTTDSSLSQLYCAPAANCVGGPGLVPARVTTHTAVRTISYSFLYARHLPVTGRAQVALVVGGGIERGGYRSSGVSDELDQNGTVVRHSTYSDDRPNGRLAAVLGVDAEVRLTSHLAVAPQFRFHTFPYPEVSIFRPGIALRWRF